MKPPRSIRAFSRAFSLLELMIVVAIMGIIMLMGIPAIRAITQREALSQGLHDICEACAQARRKAIMSGKPSELRIFPQARHIEVGDSPTYGAVDAPTDASPPLDAKSAAGFSAQLSDRLQIDFLDVNFFEFKDEDIARVRFYPNGTCDEFMMVLHSDTGDVRQITLEAVTALADSGPFKP
jgi:prepilin-type N-terminal cleavage/methylation domain-containing protein